MSVRTRTCHMCVCVLCSAVLCSAPLCVCVWMLEHNIIRSSNNVFACYARIYRYVRFGKEPASQRLLCATATATGMMRTRVLNTQMKLKFHARQNTRGSRRCTYIALRGLCRVIPYMLFFEVLALSLSLFASCAPSLCLRSRRCHHRVARIDGQVIIVAVTSVDCRCPTSIQSIHLFV